MALFPQFSTYAFIPSMVLSLNELLWWYWGILNSQIDQLEYLDKATVVTQRRSKLGKMSVQDKVTPILIFYLIEYNFFVNYSVLCWTGKVSRCTAGPRTQTPCSTSILVRNTSSRILDASHNWNFSFFTPWLTRWIAISTSKLCIYIFYSCFKGTVKLIFPFLDTIWILGLF